MVDIITTRQQHSNSKIVKRRLWTMIKVMLIFMTVLVLSTKTGASTSSAESEINDLNSLATVKESAKTENVTAKQIKPETRQYPFTGYMIPPLSLPPSLADCPLCDSSVYSYCSHKLIHDSCCCDFPGSPIYQKPPQCVYFDCSLLYAKSCYEHRLIKNCCCNSPYK